jgi:hypothetical protein
MVNFSIHQIIIIVYTKYKFVGEDLIAIEEKIPLIAYNTRNKRYRESQSRFGRMIRYYGSVYVIYGACIVLAAIILVLIWRKFSSIAVQGSQYSVNPFFPSDTISLMSPQPQSIPFTHGLPLRIILTALTLRNVSTPKP